MPNFVATERDEKIWERAKAKARQRPDYEEQSGASFYAIVTVIYKKMGGRIGKKKRLKKSLMAGRGGIWLVKSGSILSQMVKPDRGPK